MDDAAPLVGFILLTFNQEKYVEQAVRAALAQDYPNLEIILSDDGSSDRTVAIMERLKADYDGPHKVALNRRAGGAGMVAHVYDAVSKAGGELIVVAAGDDLSHPNRVSRLVEEWRRSGAEALHSGFNVIDGDGRLLEEIPVPRSRNDPSIYFEGAKVEQITGATAAYSRRLFDAVRQPDEPVMAEDYFFSLMLGLRGRKVVAVPEALVDYRSHPEALSNVGHALGGVEAFERRVAKNANWGIQLLSLLEQYASEPSLIDAGWGAPIRIAAERVRAEKALSAYQARWPDSSFIDRLAALIRFRGHSEWRWVAARVLGMRGLIAMKKARALIRQERSGQ